MLRTRTRCVRWWGTLACLAAALAAPVTADTGPDAPDLDAVRADLVGKVARAARWPAVPEGRGFDVLFVGDPGVAAGFMDGLAGRSVDGRSVLMSRMPLPAPADAEALAAGLRDTLHAAARADLVCFGPLDPAWHAPLAAAFAAPEERARVRLLVSSRPWGPATGLTALGLFFNGERIRLVSSDAAVERSRVSPGSGLLALAERLP